MRLARFAAAGLALGILAGFIAALLRPRPRVADDSAGRSLSESIGQPVTWGSRAPRGDQRVRRPALPPLIPVVPVVPKGPVAP